jgi:hypothetical protein
MANPELDNLIVDHIGDLEAAANRLITLGEEVFGKIDEAADRWATMQGWSGNYDFLEINPRPRRRGTPSVLPGLWFAPQEWLMPGTPVQNMNFRAWFQLGDAVARIDHFDLVALCREGAGALGFRLMISEDFSPWRGLKPLYKTARFIDVTEQTRFVIDSGPSFFLPVQLESAVLANCLRQDDVESALTPLETAFTSIAAAMPVFDVLLKEMPRRSPAGPPTVPQNEAPLVAAAE